jgi:hypothetical protein
MGHHQNDHDHLQMAQRGDEKPPAVKLAPMTLPVGAAVSDYTPRQARGQVVSVTPVTYVAVN